MLTLAGAIVGWLVAGWLRQSLIALLSLPVLSIPWLWVRRVVVGALFDLPMALVVVALMLLSARLIVFRPLPASIALAASIWSLDLLIAWLVSGDLGLWQDPLSVIPRASLALATVFGAAYALGWRRGQRASEEGRASDTLEKEGGDDGRAQDDEGDSV